MTGMVAGGWKLASSIFEIPFGSLTRGAVADLAVLDDEPPTPVNVQNIVPHFLFGFSSSSVESVMVGGMWMLWNRTHPMIDGGCYDPGAECGHAALEQTNLKKR
jgi:cytosine/adenosine deaminase-related metal-dependent hydrolase